MKKALYSTIGLVALTLASCTKIDNYPAPAETLKGNIIDVNTGKNMQCELSNDNGTGARIKLLEISYSANPTPLYLALKQDGSYINTKVFAATYKVVAEGPFVPLVQTTPTAIDKSQTINLKGEATVDFTVEPFLEVQWVGDPVVNANGTITASVKVTRGTTNPLFQQNITDVVMFINGSEYVGNNVFDSRYVSRMNYSGTAGNAIVGTTLTFTTTGGALPKRDWYVRVGARVAYGTNQYNYNEVKQVVVK